jgi:hypothetical protein
MLSILCFLLLAQAGPDPTPATADGTGLLFRIDLQGGYSRYIKQAPQGDPGGGFSFSGGTVAAGIHLAYAPVPHFAVGLHLFDAVQPHAASDLGRSSSNETNLAGVGPEVIVDFQGFSCSLTPAIVRLDISVQQSGNADAEGVSVLGRVGKEWTTESGTRVGLAAQVQYGHVTSDNDAYHLLHVLLVTIGGSLTFGRGLL